MSIAQQIEIVAIKPLVPELSDSFRVGYIKVFTLIAEGCGEGIVEKIAGALIVDDLRRWNIPKRTTPPQGAKY